MRKAAKKDKKKNKKPATFPWWCKIIAYILSFCFGFVSLFMVYIKGLLLGDEEVTKWITSLVVSLFSGIFLTQPIQVAVIAFIFVLIFRAPGDEKDDLGDNYCDERLANLQIKSPILSKTEEDNTQKKMTIKELKSLTEIRHKRMIEKKMNRALLEILIFGIFLFFVAVVSMQNKDRNSYHYQTTMSTYFKNEQFGGITFNDITKVDEVWRWMQNVFNKSLDANTWYNGNKTINMSNHVFDFSSVLIGNISVRQQRVKSKDCNYYAEQITKRKICNAEYSSFKREKKDFSLSWNNLEFNSSNISNITTDVYGAFLYKRSKVNEFLE